jgi:hypothetical protein
MKGFIKKRGLFWTGYWIACWVLFGGGVSIAVKTGDYGLAALLILLAIAGFTVYSIFVDKRDRKLATEAEISALAGLDRLKDGIRIVGAEAEMVLQLKSEYNPFGSDSSQLCRTKSGNWFVFDFTVFRGQLHYNSVNVLQHAEVKQLLMERQGLAEYRKYFGEPELL